MDRCDISRKLSGRYSSSREDEERSIAEGRNVRYWVYCGSFGFFLQYCILLTMDSWLCDTATPYGNTAMVSNRYRYHVVAISNMSQECSKAASLFDPDTERLARTKTSTCVCDYFFGGSFL